MSDAAKTSAASEKGKLIAEVSSIITKRTGVQLGDRQVAMVESRLKRRLLDLGLSRWQDYRAYFDAHHMEEVEVLVSLLTTHHTFFFREFVQFEYLEKQLAALASRAAARGTKRVEIFSAACSRGQEVYSLAMHLLQHLPIEAPGFDFSIFGGDVDSASVDMAMNGVYRRDELKSAPLSYLGDHWARGTGEIADFVKARKSLRDKCSFSVVNLLDLMPLAGRKFDVIFCRNVFIYFTPEQIRTIVNEFRKHLHPGGLLVVGVSESLHALGTPLKLVGPSVYSDLPPAPVKALKQIKPAVVAPTPKPAAVADPLPNPLRVLCVDDSGSILTLLKKILNREEGFEVVGTAGNGQEAAEQVAKLKPHVMTLDIHMPVQTGIEFLEKNSRHPPVVMVTSVSRDDATLAWRALSLGAADYVEKPALNNLEERADEVRMKLKAAFRSANSQVSRRLDQEFSRAAKVLAPAECTVFAVFGLGEIESCALTMKEMKNFPLVLAVEGADAVLPAVAERIAKESGWMARKPEDPAQPGTFCLLGLKAAVSLTTKRGGPISVMVWGELSKHGSKEILSLGGAQLLLEDLGGGKGATHLADMASDILPATSFSYLAHQYFSERQKRKG